MLDQRRAVVLWPVDIRRAVDVRIDYIVCVSGVARIASIRRVYIRIDYRRCYADVGVRGIDIAEVRSVNYFVCVSRGRSRLGAASISGECPKDAEANGQ